MIPLLAALLLLQDPAWSQMPVPREAGPEDHEELRRTIVEWAARPGVPELQDLAARVRIRHAALRPVYRVEVLTVEEHRELRNAVAPLTGPEPAGVAPGNLDAWAVARPEYSGWTTREFAVPVAGSARGGSCPSCAGPGRTGCPACRAAGSTPCGPCDARGKGRCSDCGGTGRWTCTGCAGRGWRMVDGKRQDCECRARKTCPSCDGSGVSGCRSCGATGKIACAACAGDGTIECAACAGRGRVLVTSEIVIRFVVVPFRHEFGRGEGPLVLLPPRGRETWRSEGGALGVALGALPSDVLRRRMTDLLEEARSRSPADRVLRQRLEVVPVEVWTLEAEWEGRPWIMTIVDGELRPDEDANPRKWWAAGAVERAVTELGYNRLPAALELAAKAAAADPSNGAARAIEAELRGRVEVAASTAPRPPGRIYRNLPPRRAPPKSDWRTSVLAVLIPIAAVIALVMGALKLYVRRR